MSQLNFEAPPGVVIEAPEHINPVFELLCRCGGDRHFVHCYRWTNPDYDSDPITLSPIDLECEVCRTITALLDTDIHGYDPEVGAGSATRRAEGERVVFECPICGRQPFQMFARFEYSDDLFDRNYSEFAGKEQELFSWFSLVGRCSQCSQMLPIADFECA